MAAAVALALTVDRPADTFLPAVIKSYMYRAALSGPGWSGVNRLGQMFTGVDWLGEIVAQRPDLDLDAGAGGGAGLLRLSALVTEREHWHWAWASTRGVPAPGSCAQWRARAPRIVVVANHSCLMLETSQNYIESLSVLISGSGPTTLSVRGAGRPAYFHWFLWYI